MLLSSDVIEPAQFWVFPRVEMPTRRDVFLQTSVAALLLIDEGEGEGLVTVRFVRMKGPDGREIPVPLASGCASWPYHKPWSDVRAGQCGLKWNGDASRKEADTNLELLWHAAASQFWLRSKVATRSSLPLSRSARRRAMRAEVDPHAVQVITLRQAEPSGSAADHEAHEYSCRWLVSSHWRQQYMPSTGTHRPTLIPPHVKGPADKPLRLHSGKAYRVSR